MDYPLGHILLDRFEITGSRDSREPWSEYLGRNTSDHSSVGISVLTSSHEPDLNSLFTTNALSLSRVQHPNVAPIHHFGLVDGETPCLVLAEVSGPTLRAYVAERGGLGWKDAVQVGLGVIDALSAIHGEGVLHRDLCSNAVRLPHGNLTAPVIDHFGIAEGQTPYDTKIQNGWASGNPGFMSPEQLYGLALDERSDVYAAALILYSCMTGDELKVDSARQALEQRVMSRLPPLTCGPERSKPPRPLATLLTAALEPDPALRPASANEFKKRLQDVAQQAGFHIPTSTPKPRTRGTNRRMTGSTAPPQADWQPPAWARKPSEKPSQAHLSARAQAVRSDDILSTSTYGEAPSQTPQATPPRLPTTARPPFPDNESQLGNLPNDDDMLADSIAVNDGSPAELPNKEQDYTDAVRKAPIQPLDGDIGFSDGDEDDDLGLPPVLRTMGRNEDVNDTSSTTSTASALVENQQTAVAQAASGEPDFLEGLQSGVAQAVIVARISPKQLRLPSESRWLLEQIGRNSYGMTVGQNVWVGTIVCEDQETAAQVANQAKAAMADRYDDYHRCEWTPVTESFEATSNSVLPSVVEGLIHYLSH